MPHINKAITSELAGTELIGVPLLSNLWLEYDEDANEVRVKLFSAEEDENTILAAGFEPKLEMAKLLGLTARATTLKYEDLNMVVKGTPPTRVSGLWTSLCMYCDLVEGYRVGDGLSSLLRILPLRVGSNDEVYEEPMNIQWLEAAAKDSDIV